MFLISPPNWKQPSREVRWNTVSEPAVEPVTLNDYYDYQRIKTTDIKESVVWDKLASARQRVERHIRRVAVSTTFDMFLDVPPDFGALTAYSWQRFIGYVGEQPIDIPKPPFIKLIGCYVSDDTDNEHTVDPANYYLSRANDPARLQVRPGFSFPDIGSRSFETFRLRFVAGYLTPFSVTANDSLVTARNHGQVAGDRIQLTNRDGILPSPLTERTDYYVVSAPDGNTLRISDTVNGSPLVFDDAGDGVQFIGVLPSMIRRAILLTASEDRFGAGSEEKRKAAKFQQSKYGISGLPEEVETILESIRVKRIA